MKRSVERVGEGGGYVVGIETRDPIQKRPPRIFREPADKNPIAVTFLIFA